MIRFPVFQRLQITGYMMYPGKAAETGIDIQFDRGAWVVIGANGLGKSTLLLILRAAFTGAATVTEPGPVGQRSDIVVTDRRFFALRVADNARRAKVTVEARIGDSTLLVERGLDDLAIIRCEVDGKPVESGDLGLEASYRSNISQLMGLSGFADVIRVLRYLVFALEDRDGLIWSPRAQSEIFRATFVPDQSLRWRQLESQIISSDSTARNAANVLNNILKRQEKEAKKLAGAAAVRAKLAALAGEQERDEQREVDLLKLQDIADDRRIDARNVLRSLEDECEKRRRAYERIKFTALRSAFGHLQETEQYLFLRLVTERMCPACHQPAEEWIAEIERRRLEKLCPICGQDRPSEAGLVTVQKFNEEKAARAYSAWCGTQEAVENATAALKTAEAEYLALRSQLATLRSEIDRRTRAIRGLERKLPPSQRRSSEADETQMLRKRIMQFRAEREDAERALEDLLQGARAAVERVRGQVSKLFARYADLFLSETFRLVYSPDRRAVGQTGRTLEFPAFELELTSGSTDGRSTRRDASQVSLSQREYLDFAFRMAMMTVLASGASSFVIDGPEGSLDAVFARRAGKMLADYAHETTGVGNRLLVASNLVDSPLFPELLTDSQGQRDASHVVNLLNLAAPTAAVVTLRAEYEEAYNRIVTGDLDDSSD